MSHLITLAAAAEDAEGVIPILPYIIPAVVALIPAIALIHNRRRGAVETKAPSVSEVWSENRQLVKEVDGERAARRFFETLAHRLGRALLSVAARLPLSITEQNALDDYNEHLSNKDSI